MSSVGLQRVIQCVAETRFDGVLNAANFLYEELCESVTQFCAVIVRSDLACLRQVQDVADCLPAPAWVGCGICGIWFTSQWLQSDITAFCACKVVIKCCHHCIGLIPIYMYKQ